MGNGPLFIPNTINYFNSCKARINNDKFLKLQYGIEKKLICFGTHNKKQSRYYDIKKI